jgi:hypothetical protein
LTPLSARATWAIGRPALLLAKEAMLQCARRPIRNVAELCIHGSAAGAWTGAFRNRAATLSAWARSLTAQMTPPSEPGIRQSASAVGVLERPGHVRAARWSGSYARLLASVRSPCQSDFQWFSCAGTERLGHHCRVNTVAPKTRSRPIDIMAPGAPPFSPMIARTMLAIPPIASASPPYRCRCCLSVGRVHDHLPDQRVDVGAPAPDRPLIALGW